MEHAINWLVENVGLMPFAWYAFVLLASAGIASYTAGRVKALAFKAAGRPPLKSPPNFHAAFVLLATLVPMLMSITLLSSVDGPIVRQFLIAELPERLTDLPPAQLDQYVDQLWALAGQPDARLTDPFDDAARWRLVALIGEFRLVGALGAALLGAIGFVVARGLQSPDAPIRAYLERIIRGLFFLSAAMAVIITVGIVLSLAVEGLRFFSVVSPVDFLFGTVWNAQTNQDFGAVPLFFGTLAVTLIAMAVAAPIGILSAVYLSEYATRRVRRLAKPAMEVLAGIPTVVYGFFAIIAIAPIIRSLARSVNDLPWVPDGFLAAQPNSALAAGLIMGIMIVPFVVSLTDDAIKSVPQDLRDGALSLGATKSEMIRQIVLPAARPGIAAALLLGVSRAIGETMIVVMVAGQRSQITLDVTSDMTTVTAQIVTLLVGDSAFDSPKTLSAFALGGVLFVVTLIFNLIAIRFVRRYRLSNG
ncbi:MAG: phosphate ABC transporter permease subunit PstC [Pseudomonadota bacterium]